MKISGEKIHLRPLTLADVTDDYYAWMNSPSVTKFLESRFRPVSKESILDYVKSVSANPDYFFMAIVLNENNRHIGNIKLGPVNWVHRLGEIGLMIGAEDCWGKGYASQAIALISSFAFENLNLHKVTAGCYAPNHASKKAFLRAGFSEEGVRPKHNFFNGEFIDAVLFGRIRPSSSA